MYQLLAGKKYRLFKNQGHFLILLGSERQSSEWSIIDINT